jgi:hypothetical protein
MVSLIISAASAFSVLLLVFCAWLTRASYWRTAAALMGGLCAAALRFGLDMVAYEFDWWTFGDTAYAPVITYVPVVFWFGAGLGLVGWRMMRNWGGVGEWIYFIGFVALGLARDVVLAIGTGPLTIAQGGLPLVIAGAGWLIMAFLVQAIMQLLVGPVDADALEPERIPQIEDDSGAVATPAAQPERDPFSFQH